MSAHFSWILIVLALLSGVPVHAFAQSPKDKSDATSTPPPEMGNVPFNADEARRLQEQWAGQKQP